MGLSVPIRGQIRAPCFVSEDADASFYDVLPAKNAPLRAFSGKANIVGCIRSLLVA